MRAVVCNRFGEPEDLTVDDRETVECPAGRVRVRIWSSGVNYVDALFVQGRYQIKPALPFVPGSEIAGEITLSPDAQPVDDIIEGRIADDPTQVLVRPDAPTVPVAILISPWIREHLYLYARQLWWPRRH